MTRLTVFILTYNHAPYMAACLDSVLSQQTDFDFKIVILDDASTDGSSDLARQYAAAHPAKITAMVRPQNLGVVENLYQGLCTIDTEYFTVLESDDAWCNPHKLQRQIDLLNANPDCDICGHDSIYKDHVTGTSHHLYDYQTPPDNDVIIFTGRTMPKAHPSSRVYRHVYDFKTVTPHAAVVFDSSLFWFYCLQNPRFIYINQTYSIYNYTGEGMYSGASARRRRWLALNAIVDLDTALQHRYVKFNQPRFAKALLKRHRWLFKLLSLYNQRRAYAILLDLNKL